MDDSFHEMIVKAQRSPFDGLKIVGLVIAGMILIFLIFIFNSWLGMIMPLLLVGVGYGLFYLLRGFSREFEYTITNGDLDIDLIVAQRKRRRVFSGAARAFESMAPIDHSASANQSAMGAQSAQSGTRAIIDCRGQVAKGLHYQILTEYKGKRVTVLFTPDEIILNQLKRFNPGRISIG